MSFTSVVKDEICSLSFSSIENIAELSGFVRSNAKITPDLIELSSENAKVAGLVIGGSLTLVHLLGIYFTGTSVNPARSFGPALLLGGEALANVWVFIAAPLLGGVIAALVWKVLYDPAE